MAHASSASSRPRTATAKRLTPGAYDALAEALAVVFWNKMPFERFVRVALRGHPALLAQLDFSPTKREVAGDLTMRLAQNEDRYQALTIDLMLALAAMESFPNLERQPDAADLLTNARAAVGELRTMTEQYSALAEERERLEQERLAEAARLEARRSHDRVLEGLKTRFVTMYNETNAQRRGREFEGLLNELFALYDLTPRKSFVLESEQIDGAFTFNTDDYLLEAKWEKDRASRGSVDQLAMKIRRKGKNTLGLFIAVSGFSGPAVEAHSNCGGALVFMDGADLFAVLDGTISLTDLLDAKRRHLSETGIPLLLVKDILGR